MRTIPILLTLTFGLVVKICAQTESGFIYPCSVLPPSFSSYCYQNCWLDTLDWSADTNLISLNTTCNLWQIGVNQKPAFGIPGQDFGIATDLDSAYPAGRSCSFKVDLPDNPLQWGSTILLFEHRYSSDSLRDGGLIEYSCNGTDWVNVVSATSGGIPIVKNFLNFPLVEDYGGYFDQNTIPTLDSLNYAFTGEITTWKWSGLQIVWALPVKSYQMSDAGCDFNTSTSVQFRFSFSSDTVSDGKPGWMIRNLVVGSADIGGGGGELINIQGNLYPNPAKSEIHIKNGLENSEVRIMNSLGQVELKSKNYKSGIDLTKLASGFYWVQFESKEGLQIDKFIKE